MMFRTSLVLLCVPFLGVAAAIKSPSSHLRKDIDKDAQRQLEPLDATATLDALLEGVTSIASGTQPGKMIAYKENAVNVLMYPKASHGPCACAATMGSGRVFAMPDHQMMNFKTYGEQSGQLYRNAIKWVTNTEDKNITIVTYDSKNKEWLEGEGYTGDNIIVANEQSLVASLAGLGPKSLFVPSWLGDKEPAENIQAIKDFVNGGGGLMITEFLEGYNWWWKDKISAANTILEDAGIQFVPETTWLTGDITPTRAEVQLTLELTTNYFSAPELLSQAQKDYMEDYFMARMNLLPGGNAALDLIDADLFAIVESINPTPDSPVSDAEEKKLLNFERDRLATFDAEKVNEMGPHRLAFTLFGDIPADTPRIPSKTVKINTNRNRWQPTGMYAYPADIVTITVPEVMAGKGLRVQVSALKDDINVRDSWERPPVVHRWFPIESTEVKVANAFGGNIFIDLRNSVYNTPKINAGYQDVIIENAIEAPYFDAATMTDADWQAELAKPAPYAVLVSKDENMWICEARKDFASLTEPVALMQWWQDTLYQQDYLNGFTTTKHRYGGEAAVIDLQISIGAGHSGYPYMGYDKHWGSLTDINKFRKSGSWGDYHELGHNRQRSWWTFSSGGEVTNNVFACYNMRQSAPNAVGGWADKCIRTVDVFSRARDAVDDGANTCTGSKTYSSISYKWGFWFHIGDAFGYNETLRKVFESYEIDNDNGVTMPSGDLAEKSEWFIRFSNFSKHDMTRYMVDCWGLEVTQEAKDTVAAMALPSWLPAMGTFNSASTKYERPVTFDLSPDLMSFDGIQTITDLTDPSNGALVSNGNNVYTYTPPDNWNGTATFTYTVESSTGHKATTDVEIIVFPALRDDQFEANFPTKSSWSGIWTAGPADELVNGERIWYHDGNDLAMYFDCGKWIVWNDAGVKRRLTEWTSCTGFSRSTADKKNTDFVDKDPWLYIWNLQETFERPETASPSMAPSAVHSSSPTKAPITPAPTKSPTKTPTRSPSASPSVFVLGDDQFIVDFPNNSGWSGVYTRGVEVRSDDANGIKRYIWYQKNGNHIIWNCQNGNYIISGKQYAQSIIDANGAQCGGFGWSSWTNTGPQPWQYSWNKDEVFERPPSPSPSAAPSEVHSTSPTKAPITPAPTKTPTKTPTKSPSAAPSAFVLGLDQFEVTFPNKPHWDGVYTQGAAVGGNYLWHQKNGNYMMFCCSNCNLWVVWGNAQEELIKQQDLDRSNGPECRGLGFSTWSSQPFAQSDYPWEQVWNSDPALDAVFDHQYTRSPSASPSTPSPSASPTEYTLKENEFHVEFVTKNQNWSGVYIRGSEAIKEDYLWRQKDGSHIMFRCSYGLWMVWGAGAIPGILEEEANREGGPRCVGWGWSTYGRIGEGRAPYDYNWDRGEIWSFPEGQA